MSDHEVFKKELLEVLPSILGAAGVLADVQNHSEPYGELSRSKATAIAKGLRAVANEIDLEIMKFQLAVDAQV